jgi:diadenosine tetraphosphate (Ap4A) HIT family hydrolase
MNKIILAATTALAMFAMSNVAEARVRHGKNTQYSAMHEVEDVNPLEAIFGGDNWTVSPQPKFKTRRQARQYQENQEEFFGGASSSIVAYGHQLQRQGFRVSEHPAFGGVHHVHAHHSAHYSGNAIDVNVGRGVREASSAYAYKFDQLAADARAAGYKVLWRVPGHYDHIHIQH